MAGYVNEYSARSRSCRRSRLTFPNNFNRRDSPRVALGSGAYRFGTPSPRP